MATTEGERVFVHHRMGMSESDSKYHMRTSIRRAMREVGRLANNAGYRLDLETLEIDEDKIENTQFLVIRVEAE